MRVEGVQVGERLVADVALLQALARVQTHVVFQLLLLGEDHVTDGTGLSLLASVSPFHNDSIVLFRSNQKYPLLETLY